MFGRRRTDSDYLRSLERMANRNQVVPPSVQVACLIIIALVVLYSCVTRAEPLPVPKPPERGGSCAHRCTSSRSFCVPSQGAQGAIAKPANCVELRSRTPRGSEPTRQATMAAFAKS
jgi:hypothetical protein